ncbi:hypothetical protein H2199_007956 [Coniosporium tulheliwenetii]|uniref:Uncharacterized protein n=1 Tax=Coniosporium tulheliwenetii TaxID=3383036 RepID=A0ACC2YLP3_9PEZI|nr:hypothetical protein H2199_007956 [Cladosporium sp. JES 115]
MTANQQRRLPYQQLTILAICRFAEPIALTSIFPYLPEMIESFSVPKNEIAKWAGITSSIFSLSQCVMGIPWGRASDIWGRKPVILIGLVNTMLTSLLWGFSTSLPMALVARALSGAGNGNVGIIRTMVAEMCPWKELQPRAFSIMPLVFNIGSVIGPAIGGALSNPLRRPPGAPRGDSFFERYPYALPNLVAACFFFVGIFTGIFFLHETLGSKKARRDYGLVLGEKLSSAVSHRVQRARRRWRKAREGETEPLLSPEAGRTEYPDVVDEESAEAEEDLAVSSAEEKAPGYREVLSRQSVYNLLVYTLLALHSLGYDQLLPVFMHHPAQSINSPDVDLPLQFSGGFGINSARIGILFTLYGVAGIIFQLFLFPPVARRYGVLRCLRVSFCVAPVMYILTPFTALLPTTTSRMVCIFALMLFKGCANTFAFPGSTILLTNTANSLRVLGTLNGIATSVSAIGRAAGPAIGGALFTIGAERNYIVMPFWALAAIAAIAASLTFLLEEGEGFGDDAESDDGEDGEEEEDGKVSETAASSGPMSKPGSHSDAETGFGVPAPLLSRVSTFSTSSVRQASIGSGSAVQSIESPSDDTEGQQLRRPPQLENRGTASTAKKDVGAYWYGWKRV